MKQEQPFSHARTSASQTTDLASLLPLGWPTDQPVARVWTCGPLTLDVLHGVHASSAAPHQTELLYKPPITPLTPKRGRSSATILLTLLASQPGGYAAKDFLSEHLRQGRGANQALDEENDLWEAGLSRVDNIVSLLRRLLCPPGVPHPKALGRLLVAYVPASQASGPGYRLAGAPLLWTDIEAIRAAIKAARLFEQAGQASNALKQWQMAYTLLTRGSFGDREPYSDWASACRLELDTQCWACVQALWRGYAARGETGEMEALRILQDYWPTHVTQEDALRPLLELFGKHECFGQAEEAYGLLCRTLQKEGRQPDHRTTATMELVRCMQLQRMPILVDSTCEHEIPASIPVVSQPRPAPADFPYSIARDIIQAQVIPQPLPPISSVQINAFDRATLFTATINGLVNQWQGRAAQCADLQVLLSQEFAMFEQDALQQKIGEQQPLSRRQALIAIAALPYGALAAARLSGTELHPEAFLPQSTAAITSCWSIMQDREFGAVEQALSHCLPALSTLAHQASPYQQSAANLAAQGNILLGLVALHSQQAPQSFRQRLLYCKQAVEQAEHLADPTLQIVSLHHLGCSERDLGNFPAMIAACEEAVRLSSHELVSPTLRRKVFISLAQAYARAGQTQQALRYHGEIKTSLPSVNDQVPAYLQDSGLFWEDLTEAQMFGDLGKQEDGKSFYKRGWKAMEQAENLLPSLSVPERFRVEGVNQKALLALRLGYLDQFRDLFIQGIQGAKALQSEKRRQEVIALWKEARKVWPREPRVTELADLLLE